MHARRWISNESEVLKEISEEDRAMEVILKCGEFPSSKTWRILWKPSNDAFTITFKDASVPCCKEDEHTKPNFLNNIITLFNPLGFLSPYVVQRKVLLQEIWITHLDWDDNSPLNISKKSNEVFERIRNTIKFSSSKMLTIFRWSFRIYIPCV